MSGHGSARRAPRRPARARAVLPAAAVALLAPAAAAQDTIGGATYARLGTREQTREAVVRQLVGYSARWGRWQVLAPFDHPAGATDIAAPFPPEQELPAMAAGGAGPDLARTHAGKAGRAIAWREVEQEPDIGGPGGLRPIDLEAGLPPGGETNAVAYLYRAIEAERACSIPVTLGSDDGVRVWLNGELLLDVNAARPLDPSAHRLTLALQPGVNHLLVKVSQGAGEWQFQMTHEPMLDPAAEAALDWRLDEDFPDDESRYYRISTIPVPRGVELEVGGLDVLPDGRPILCTRRGEVYIVDGASDTPATGARWTLFASGLQEPLGLRAREEPDGLAVYMAQRAELTRLLDSDRDGDADEFQTVCDAWRLSGNYHEYAFGPEIDRDGNFWVTLNLAHDSGDGTVMGAPVPTRGWAVRISPDGAMHKVADGLRSPDGIGIFADGQMFYTDNQGDYVATNKLSPLYEGSFHGHQASLKHRDGWENWQAKGLAVPEITPPAVWFPYQKMGQSASDLMLDTTAGRFGPFAGQLFVGDQTHALVMRVFLERVGGEAGVYQGACFPFRGGFASGVHRLRFAPDGSLFVGMTDRGWGSTGPKRFGLQRLIWTGRTPFDILAMRAVPDGFELEFTRDLDGASLADARFRMTSYTYRYHPQYGSPEEGTMELRLTAEPAGARLVRLRVEPLRTGHVHELHIEGLTAPDDAGGARVPLLHGRAYYTLNAVPTR